MNIDVYKLAIRLVHFRLFMTINLNHMPKINLIVGGDSTIGRALADHWRDKKILFHASTRRRNQISPERPFIDLSLGCWPDNLDRYAGAVLCAGISRLAKCEHNIDDARRVNVTNTARLAKTLTESGCFVLFLSTNHVFDGTKPLRTVAESVCPINEYGRQKAAAEKQLLPLQKLAILRLTKVVYREMPLLKHWRQDLLDGKVIYPFSDMTFAPIWLSEVIQCVDSLVNTPQHRHGIIHLSGQDQSYYDFATHLFADLARQSHQIKPDSYKNTEALALIAIPKFTSLGSA